MGVFKRGKVYWVRYAGPGGEIIRESARTTNYREAVNYLIKCKQAVLDSTWKPIPQTQYTFKKLAEEYVQWAQRQKSFKEKFRIIQHLVKRFGHLRLNKFSPILIEHYQTERLNKGNKPATVNRHIATLKHMFTKAVEWEMVKEDVLMKVRKVKMLPENNKRLRFLTHEECKRLIMACDSTIRPIVILALNTGMKTGMKKGEISPLSKII